MAPTLPPFQNTSTTASPAPSLAASLNIPYVTAELFIAALSTAGNLLVCVAVATERRLRTVTNYFLVSLAVADVCVGALAIPCAILTDMGIPRNTHSQTQQTRALTHPQLYLCLFMLSVLIMLTQSSILSLLAVAVERYVAIFLPFRHQRYMTGRLAVLVIVCVWVLAFLMGLVPLMGWYREGAGESGRCSFVQVVDMRYMVFFNFFVCVLAPLVVMLLLYAHIFSLAQRQARRINQETQLGRRINVERQVNLKQEVKTATSVFMVLFLFAICWLPLHIINCFLLLSPASPVPLPLLLTAIILSHANSALNPLLYAYKMRPFRHAFKRLLCCK
ncbi:adenosine receptor A2a-like [Engraulis encrasicolus]|uniref:adenosine receptor A2a-like n=1 Tax=Engraulis encrasicolus TaxID=184585 RepID=UPI002FD73DF7